MNWHKLIRHLVVECHLSYRDVLELTPIQAVALVTAESDPPGLLQPQTILELTAPLLEALNHGRN